MQGLRKEERQYSIKDRTGTEHDKDRAGQKKTDKKRTIPKNGKDKQGDEKAKTGQEKDTTNKLTRKGQS